jgi:hypothetical protein
MYIRAWGKKIKPSKLSYNEEDFKGDTNAYYIIENSFHGKGDPKHSVERKGSADFIYTSQNPPTLTDEQRALKDDINRRTSYIIKDKSGQTVFPKNASFKKINKNIAEGISLSGEEYTGDIYKEIYYYDISAGYVAGARYYPDRNSLCIGLYDLDGSPYYEYSSQYFDYDSRTVNFRGNDDAELVSFSGEYFYFKTDTGYNATDLKGSIKKNIICQKLRALTGEVYYTEKEENGRNVHRIGSLSGGETETDQTVNEAENGIVVFYDRSTYSYYKADA